MKKILLSSAAMLLATFLFAQPHQTRERLPKPAPPPAIRWKHDSIKLQLYVQLLSPQIPAVKDAFHTFYKKFDELMESGKAPKSEAEKIINGLNMEIKTVFNAGQLERFQAFQREFLPPPPHPSKQRTPESL